ncbi:MAG: hypothetical protein RL559_1630 [Pseudomonadota bacterium]
MVDAKKIGQWVVLGTGGTIAGTAATAEDHTGYTAAQLGVQTLLEGLPGLHTALRGDALHCEQVAQLNSKDMDHGVWQRLAQRCAHWLAQPKVRGVLVTHGTDTLEETAWFLQSVLAPAKPLVMTCAMRPATAVQADGPQNLLDALATAREAAGRGVLVVCGGRVHRAAQVQKIHPYRLDAFDSGEAGPAGWVEQGQVRWAQPVAHAELAHPQAALALTRPAQDWPWVAVLHGHAGASGRQVQALLEAGVRGLVLAGSGNGQVHAEWLPALQQAQAQGVAVRLVSRCAQGQIVGEAAQLPLAPRGLNVYKARIALMLELMA